jgi:hypothetical protein
VLHAVRDCFAMAHQYRAIRIMGALHLNLNGFHLGNALL